MSTDDQTIAFYNAEAKAYAETAEERNASPRIDAFIDRLPEDARVLDLGAGSGWAIKRFKRAGHRADGIEPARELAEEGARRYGIEIRPGHFLTLSARQRYDGIWCNFALQHAPRSDRPAIFERIHTALRPGGILHIGVPKGPTDWRDDHGRIYAPFTQAEMEELLTGFTDLEWESDAGEAFDGTRMLMLFVTAVRV